MMTRTSKDKVVEREGKGLQKRFFPKSCSVSSPTKKEDIIEMKEPVFPSSPPRYKVFVPLLERGVFKDNSLPHQFFMGYDVLECLREYFDKKKGEDELLLDTWSAFQSGAITSEKVIDRILQNIGMNKEFVKHIFGEVKEK